MILRVKLPGALYRLSLNTCGDNHATLNTAIIRLLEHPGWLEQVLDDMALASSTSTIEGDEQ
jgi:hypothetical protein